MGGIRRGRTSDGIKTRPWGLVVLGVWFVVCLGVVGSLMVGHWVSLPVPNAAAAQRLETLGASPPGAKRPWLVVHALYGKCTCSQRIFESLVSTTRPRGVREILLLADAAPTWRAQAHAAGLEIRGLTAPELKERYGIEAAPLFMVFDPQGRLVHTGGYTERKQGLAIVDRAIVEALMAEPNAPRPPLPVFGCGVSRQLQQLLDPLGIKS
ncbi:MAG: hypothetical protein KA712_08740 [Myxococcales bacterium]|nr:hypothetical protein [Myxococcales bacterium]